MDPIMTLDQLEKSQIARVSGFKNKDISLVARLREIGFAEQDEVELLYRGPFGGRPLCYRLNRTLIALRRDEAKAVEVEAVS
jgi:ferrous iron transport protein A